MRYFKISRLILVTMLILIAALLIGADVQARDLQSGDSASSTPQATQQVEHRTLSPESEFFQLSFPVDNTLGYSSYVDHSNTNGGFYTQNGNVEPYTGEVAASTRHLPDPNLPSIVCYDVTQNGREYCYDGHSGLDIPVRSGNPVYAADAGTVRTACISDQYCNTGYGKVVIIQDKYNTSLSTLYGHNSQLLVNVNNIVARGQLIAYSGSTGAGTAAHLHFGTYVNLHPNFDNVDAVGTTLDPYGWFSQKANTIGAPVTDYKWASGYPPSNSATDPVNWNMGTLIGSTYVDKYKNKGQPYAIGATPASPGEDPIEDWWANNYGSAGVPTRGYYYDPTRNAYCEDFEAGTYCTDGSYRTVVVGAGAFTDTPLNHWANRYIGWVHREGVMNGSDANTCAANGVSYPCFLPDSYLTRGQLAVTMVNGFGLQPYGSTSQQYYCDVAPNDWDYYAAETLYTLGIMQGQPIQGKGCTINGISVNLYFIPNRNVLRSELSRALVQFGLIYPQGSGTHWIPYQFMGGGPDFCDVPDPNDTVCPHNGYEMWYGYVETLYNYGIISFRQEVRGPGNGGQFRPNLQATRAQIAMFFHEMAYASGSLYHYTYTPPLK